MSPLLDPTSPSQMVCTSSSWRQFLTSRKSHWHHVTAFPNLNVGLNRKVTLSTCFWGRTMIMTKHPFMVRTKTKVRNQNWLQVWTCPWGISQWSLIFLFSQPSSFAKRAKKPQTADGVRFNNPCKCVKRIRLCISWPMTSVQCFSKAIDKITCPSHLSHAFKEAAAWKGQPLEGSPSNQNVHHKGAVISIDLGHHSSHCHVQELSTESGQLHFSHALCRSQGRQMKSQQWNKGACSATNFCLSQMRLSALKTCPASPRSQCACWRPCFLSTWNKKLAAWRKSIYSASPCLVPMTSGPLWMPFKMNIMRTQLAQWKVSWQRKHTFFDRLDMSPTKRNVFGLQEICNGCRTLNPQSPCCLIFGRNSSHNLFSPAPTTKFILPYSSSTVLG